MIELTPTNIDGISFAEGITCGRALRYPTESSVCASDGDVVILVRFDAIVDSLFNFLCRNSNVVAAVSDHASPIGHLHWCLAYFGLRLIIVEEAFNQILDGEKLTVLHNQGRIIVNGNLDEHSFDERCDGLSSLGQYLGPIEFYAQIQRIDEVVGLNKQGFQGVGEIKSEICFDADFGNWTEFLSDMPASAGHTWQLPVRFFDYCSDKIESHQFVAGPLGDRGVRIIKRQKEIWEHFVANLSEISSTKVCAVLPMVNTASEVSDLRGMANRYGVELAVLVETPAAVAAIDEIVDLVDYIFIGVNDLTQYTYAWDRRFFHPTFTPNDQLPSATYSQVIDVVNVCRDRGVGCQIILDMWPNDALVEQIISLGKVALTIPPKWIGPWQSKITQAMSP